MYILLYGIHFMTISRSQGTIQDIISYEDELILLEKALSVCHDNRFNPGLSFECCIDEHTPIDESLYRDMYINNSVNYYIGSNL